MNECAVMPRRAASAVNSARIQLRAALTRAGFPAAWLTLCERLSRANETDSYTSLKTLNTYKVSDEVNNSFLCFHVRFDVALGGGERSMSSEHLNVSERPSNSRDCARCIGDECATS